MQHTGRPDWPPYPLHAPHTSTYYDPPTPRPTCRARQLQDALPAPPAPACGACPAPGSAAAAAQRSACGAVSASDRADYLSSIIRACGLSTCEGTVCPGCCEGLPARTSALWQTYSACMWWVGRAGRGAAGLKRMVTLLLSLAPLQIF